MTIRERLGSLKVIAWLIADLEQEREWAKNTLAPFPGQWEKWEDIHQDSIYKLKAQRQATFDLIDRLDHQLDCDILLARYRDSLTWEEVAQRLQYSASNLKRRHKLALERLEALDDENQTC